MFKKLGMQRQNHRCRKQLFKLFVKTTTFCHYPRVNTQIQKILINGHRCPKRAPLPWPKPSWREIEAAGIHLRERCSRKRMSSSCDWFLPTKQPCRPQLAPCSAPASLDEAQAMRCLAPDGVTPASAVARQGGEWAGEKRQHFATGAHSQTSSTSVLTYPVRILWNLLSCLV